MLEGGMQETSRFVVILCKKKKRKSPQIVILLPNRLILSLTVYYKRSILSGIRHTHRLRAYVSYRPYGSFVLKVKSSLTTSMIIDDSDMRKGARSVD